MAFGGATCARVLVALWTLACSCTLAEPSRGEASDAGRETIRGITISTHGSGRDWGDEAPMRQTMQDLAGLGTNWVTIHPYARIGADGSVQFRNTDPNQVPDAIGVPIRVAHELGLKILIKPHLAYWGSPFAWRGEIRFDDDAAWERFWRDYTRWIATLAQQSRGADAFAVGTELDATLDHADRWRTVIAEVRKRFDAPLTYASNWTDFERVTFWNELDAIGIQGYFPVAERPAASEAEIEAGWAKLSERLRTFSAKVGRPIVFTELGYNRNLETPMRPWEYRTDGPEAALVQQRCMRVALRAIEREPSIVGAFLWKWFPEPNPVGRNFPLATPGMREVLRQSWKGE